MKKAFKNIVLYFDFIFYRKWVTSIYNADFRLEKNGKKALQNQIALL